MVAARSASALRPLARLGVDPGQPGDLRCLGLGLAAELEARLGGDQVEVERGDLEQDRVGGGRGVEPRPIDVLVRGQGLEDGVGQRADDVHGRDGDRLRGQRPRTAAEVERLLGRG